MTGAPDDEARVMPVRTVKGQTVLVPVNKKNLLHAAKYGVPSRRGMAHGSGASSQPLPGPSTSGQRGQRAATAPPSMSGPPASTSTAVPLQALSSTSGAWLPCSSWLHFACNSQVRECGKVEGFATNAEAGLSTLGCARRDPLSA